MAREDRPAGGYFEGLPYPYRMTQGDVFDEVAWPSLPDAIAYDVLESGEQVYMPGTWSFKQAMVITVHQALWPDDGSPGVHAAILVPLEPVNKLVGPDGALTQAQLDEARAYDDLLNYMYIPEDQARGIEESMAQLFQPFCVHRDSLSDQCIGRLNYVGRQQLQRKLCMLTAHRSLPRGGFNPVP